MFFFPLKGGFELHQCKPEHLFWGQRLTLRRIHELTDSGKIINKSITDRHHLRPKQYFSFTLTFRCDEASDSVRSSTSRLHKLHLGHDDVVLQHGAAAHADGVAAGLVHIDVRAAAVLAHLRAHGAASKPANDHQHETNRKKQIY